MESSIALFERALAEAAEAQAPLEQLRFSVLLANALIDVGAFGRAEQALADVIRIAEGSADPVTSARIFWSQSRLHSMRGEPALAGRYARRALAILERTENNAYVGMAYHLAAYAEIESGNFEDALALLERGRELFGDEIGKRDDARFSIEEARALVGLDRHAEAARAASRALELLETMQPADRGRAFVTLADVFLASGDRLRARMLLEQGLDNLIEHGNRFALDAGRRLAELLEADGDTAGALDVLKRATTASAAGGRTSLRRRPPVHEHVLESGAQTDRERTGQHGPVTEARRLDPWRNGKPARRGAHGSRRGRCSRRCRRRGRPGRRR